MIACGTNMPPYSLIGQTVIGGAREYHARRRKGDQRHALDHSGGVNRDDFACASLARR